MHAKKHVIFSLTLVLSGLMSAVRSQSQLSTPLNCDQQIDEIQM